MIILGSSVVPMIPVPLFQGGGPPKLYPKPQNHEIRVRPFQCTRCAARNAKLIRYSLRENKDAFRSYIFKDYIE